MAVNLADLSYFAPLLTFLLVCAFCFAVLIKIKIFGEHKGGLLFLSFIIATLFVFLTGAREYVQTVTPWFAVLLLSFTFILILIGFAGNVPEGFNKGLGVFFICVLILIFIISAIVVFSADLAPYLPGNAEYGTTAGSSWLYSSNVFGAIVLLIVAGIVSFFLLKAS